MLKLKFQYFGPLMQRTKSFEKTLMLGKIEGKRRRGQQTTRRLNVDMNLSKCWETVKNREVCHAAVHGSQSAGHNLVTEQQSNTIASLYK